LGVRRCMNTLGRQHGAAQPPAAFLPAPVAWGNFREDGTCVGLTERFEDTTRWLNPRPLFLSFRPPAAQPAPPAAPAGGGLVERVCGEMTGDDDPSIDARAAIRSWALGVEQQTTTTTEAA